MAETSMTRWNELRARCLPEGEPLRVGEYTSSALRTDPKHLLFTLSRYKAAGKMLPLERGDTLELGCGDGVGSLILGQFSHKVLGIDGDVGGITSAKELGASNITFVCDDFLSKKYGQFDAVVSLDVIEHIPSHLEKLFFYTVLENCKPDGICVIGTPNATAERYTFETNLESHVNLFEARRLYDTLREYFCNVILFGMNDEVLHTGFHPMCHYLFALACNKRNK